MARRQMNNKIVGGRQITTEFVPSLGVDAFEYGLWKSTVDGEPTRSIFVRNLSYYVIEQDLQDLFSKAINVVIPRHINTGCPKGYVDGRCVSCYREHIELCRFFPCKKTIKWLL